MKNIFYVVLVTLLAFTGIFYFVQPYYIYSEGMAPYIDNGDMVLLKKHPQNYDVNDTVIYENGVELVGTIVLNQGIVLR